MTTDVVRAAASQGHQQGVLAVVVVYERTLDRVAPWAALCAAMNATAVAEADCGLVLRQVLVYDNSAVPKVLAQALPRWAHVVHDPANGGTAAAYRRALQDAQAAGLPWLLLLDDDTRLPDDLLAQAGAALRCDAAPALPGAVLPRVRHGGDPVSPARITRWGSMRPLACDEPGTAVPALTGIASGALVQVQAWRALAPLPEALWLDYVDHWVFAGLRRQGHALRVSGAVLEHDLSVSEPRRLSERRLASILAGEALFTRTLGWPARWLQPLRLLWRALRVSPLGLAQRAGIVGHLVRGGCWRRG